MGCSKTAAEFSHMLMQDANVLEFVHKLLVEIDYNIDHALTRPTENSKSYFPGYSL